MRSSWLVLLIVTTVIGCCGDFTNADSATIKDLTYPKAGNAVRNLNGLGQDATAITTEDEERAILEGLTTKVDDVFKKSSSLRKVKSFSAKEGELSKMKTLGEKAVDLRKAKSFAARNPDLRNVKSLVGKNPQKLTQEQLKSAVSFVEKNPKKGPSIIKWLLGITAFVTVMTAVGTVIYASTRSTSSQAKTTTFEMDIPNATATGGMKFSNFDAAWVL